MKINEGKLKDISKKLLLFFSTLILFVYWFINKEITISNIIECFGYSILLTSIVIRLIDHYFWKRILLFFKKYDFLWNLLESYETPILKKQYDCLIDYNWKGKKGTKKTKVKIEQTYTSITVSLKTDEIESSTIISEIVKSNNQFILYYLYVTNPKAKFSKKNPIQLGGCKIILESLNEINSNDTLRGTYWTTSKTIGDMKLY